MSSADLKDVIRRVLSEEANKRRSDSNRIAHVTGDLQSSIPVQLPNVSAGSTASPDDRFRALRDRIATLEDVLVKSEADRAAVYDRCEKATKAMQASQEERTALIQSLHEAGTNSANAIEMEGAQREVLALRDQMMRLQDDKVLLQRRLDESERSVKALKREKKQLLAETDGVSLADLHYSNERLSAQLVQLQRQQQQQDMGTKAAESARIVELDYAVKSLTQELETVERRVATMTAGHDEERRRLQDQLDRQFREFSVERAECDSVVSALATKVEALQFRVEALTRDNTLLKTQLETAQSRHHTTTSGMSPSAGRVKSMR
jgi:hypothetical protein